MNARYSTSYRQQSRLVRSNAMRAWVVILVAALIYLPWVMTSHSIFGLHLTLHELLNMNMTQINFTLVYIVGALGLNLSTGYTGLISIGNGAFYAIGAMVAASIGISGCTCRSSPSCSRPASRVRSSAPWSACRPCGSAASICCSARSHSSSSSPTCSSSSRRRTSGSSA